MLVASADALDQYFIRHPAMLIGRPVEAAILDHASAEIRDLHLACAAYEAPITEADDAILGAGAYAAAVRLTEFGDLRVTPAGVVWARARFPAGHVALRSSSSDVVAIVDTDTGRSSAPSRAPAPCRTVHEGAVYLHLGESSHVPDLDLEERVARVQPFAEQWYTQAQTATMTEIDEPLEAREELGVDLAFGGVTVTEQVLAYQRRALPRHEVIDTHELDLPPGTFATQALWFCVPDAMLDDLDDPLGSLHAAEHALISVLPLHAMCDRWDIGGLSTNLHPHRRPTIFIYDGHPGGIGITRRGYDGFAALVRDARDVIRDCPCSDGCPSCVQSPSAATSTIPSRSTARWR